jgi:hypothetical protein
MCECGTYFVQRRCVPMIADNDLNESIIANAFIYQRGESTCLSRHLGERRD